MYPLIFAGKTVIFAGIMRCGLFSYIGCVAILLLGYLPGVG